MGTRMKQESLDILGGVPNPEDGKHYKARNGLYYNGYCLSADCAEDAFGECMKKLSDELEKELKDGTT